MVPAVILVLLCCLGAVQLAGAHLLLQDAASDAARILARGEPLAAAQRVRELVPGATFGHETRNGMVCASLRQPAAVAGGLLSGVTLTATSCALAP